jgi:hypothetical protein
MMVASLRSGQLLNQTHAKVWPTLHPFILLVNYEQSLETDPHSMLEDACNRGIVGECYMLIAMPGTDEDERTSETWSTIQYSWRRLRTPLLQAGVMRSSDYSTTELLINQSLLQ